MYNCGEHDSKAPRISSGVLVAARYAFVLGLTCDPRFLLLLCLDSIFRSLVGTKCWISEEKLGSSFSGAED